MTTSPTEDDTMLQETTTPLFGGPHAANEATMQRERQPVLADTVIASPRLAGCDAGVIWIDARHDAHWVAADDPDFEHLVAIFVHAGHLEDLELRAMIEELVAPRVRAMLMERLEHNGQPGGVVTGHDIGPSTPSGARGRTTPRTCRPE